MSKPVNMAPVQWFGGKGNLKHKLLPMIPYANSYVEPFGGGGSILFARRPSPIEMYNDLDGRLVNLFRVLQNREQREALEERLAWTLYARDERRLAIVEQYDDDPVTAAWGFFVQNAMDIAAANNEDDTWSFSSKSSSGRQVKTFNSRKSALLSLSQRLANVHINNIDFGKLLYQMDCGDCVFYIDPPYISNTRKGGKYKHEMDDADHERLISQLLTLQGAVVLSGYEHPIYEPLTENGWELTRIDWHIETQDANGKQAPRVECVWRNPRCLQMLNKTSLF